MNTAGWYCKLQVFVVFTTGGTVDLQVSVCSIHYIGGGGGGGVKLQVSVVFITGEGVGGGGGH